MKKLLALLSITLLLSGCSLLPESSISSNSEVISPSSNSSTVSSEPSSTTISSYISSTSTSENPYLKIDGGYDLYKVIENEEKVFNINDFYYGYYLKSDGINMVIDGNSAIGYSSMFNKPIGYKASVTNYIPTSITMKEKEIEATIVRLTFATPTDFGELNYKVDTVDLIYYQENNDEYMMMDMQIYETYRYQYILKKVDVPSYLNEENMNKEYEVKFSCEFMDIPSKNIKFGQLIDYVTPPQDVAHARFIKWVLYENHEFKDFSFDEYIVIKDINLIALYHFDMYELCYINTNIDAGTIECNINDVHYYYVDQSQPSSYGMGNGDVEYYYEDVCYESIVTLSVTINEYYDFLGWYENDELISEDYIYEFSMTSNRTIEAKFE